MSALCQARAQALPQPPRTQRAQRAQPQPRLGGVDAGPAGAARTGAAPGAALRAFFALQPPAALRDSIAALAERLRGRPGGAGVRWTPPGNYHLTLCFLGGVAAPLLAGLIREAAQRLAGAAPFAVKLGAPRLLPPRQPRVLVLDCAPAAPLQDLAQRLAACAGAAGLAPPRRAFRPHLTLGRLRARRFPKLDVSPPGAAWPASQVVLFRSELAREGARYSALETFVLERVTPGMH